VNTPSMPVIFPTAVEVLGNIIRVLYIVPSGSLVVGSDRQGSRGSIVVSRVNACPVAHIPPPSILPRLPVVRSVLG
jgi:hypothetical protein